MIVRTGDFVATSGIYRLVGVLGAEHEEITLAYGDPVPKHKGENARFKLVRAAPHPTKG
jgi:hypothetical protein